jgi:hypothetical protein
MQPHLLVQNRNTLVGIISGGVDCKKGYPSWYTKVAFYRYVQNEQAKSCHIQGTTLLINSIEISIRIYFSILYYLSKNYKES